MKKSHVATMWLLGILSLGVVVYGSGPAYPPPHLRAVNPAQDIAQRDAEVHAATGRLTLLRVNESGWYHVIFKLDSEPHKSFTFALGGSSKEAMFSLLREAFVRNMTVEISSKSYPKSSDNTIIQVSLKR